MLETGGLVWWALTAISLAANIIQFLSYQSDRRQNDAYRQLFDEAKRDRKALRTEEEAEELAKLAMTLQTQVTDEIPKQARRVFFEEQRYTLATSISRLYKEYEKASAQLESMQSAGAISDELRATIERDLAPSYLETHRQQRRIYLLVILVAFFTLIPSPLYMLLPAALNFLGQGNSGVGWNSLLFGIGIIVTTVLAIKTKQSWPRPARSRQFAMIWAGTLLVLTELWVFAAGYFFVHHASRQTYYYNYEGVTIEDIIGEALALLALYVIVRLGYRKVWPFLPRFRRPTLKPK